MITTQDLARYLQEVGNNVLRAENSESARAKFRIESVGFLRQPDHENVKLCLKLIPFDQARVYAEQYKVAWARGFSIGVVIGGFIALLGVVAQGARLK